MTARDHDNAGSAAEMIEKAEFQRRVRGMLASIRALLRQTAEEAVSIEDYLMKAEGRLDAIARVQTNFLFNAEFEIDLHQLVADELLAFGLREGPGLAVRGPAVRLRERTAQSLALALHQLAASSLGTGTTAGPHPTLDVAWSVSTTGPEPQLILTFDMPAAKGAEAPAEPGGALGFSEHALRYEIGGSICWTGDEETWRCTIAVPQSLGRGGGGGTRLWRDLTSGA